MKEVSLIFIVGDIKYASQISVQESKWIDKFSLPSCLLGPCGAQAPPR